MLGFSLRNLGIFFSSKAAHAAFSRLSGCRSTSDGLSEMLSTLIASSTVRATSPCTTRRFTFSGISSSSDPSLAGLALAVALLAAASLFSISAWKRIHCCYHY